MWQSGVRFWHYLTSGMPFCNEAAKSQQKTAAPDKGQLFAAATLNV